MNATEIGADWVGRVVDEKFPLLGWLGGSGNTGVFATKLDGPQPQKVAIKLIATESAEADRRIAGWAATASLSHPHLMKAFCFGRSQIDETAIVYFVTEYADEILSQIIPERALTPQETREMLDPVIDVLTYLHSSGFVHGRLKPSNIMVVAEQLKLSSDSMLAAGAARDHLPRGIHDAPESNRTAAAPARDMWSFGMTMVEALTQHPPLWNRSADQSPIVPTSLPQPFASIAEKCLRADPARRCTLSEAKAILHGDVKAGHEPLHHPRPRDAHKFTKKASTKIPAIPLIVVLLVLIAIIAVLSLRAHRQQTPPAPGDSRPASASSAISPPSESSKPSTSSVEKGAVAARSLPDVPGNASATIHGTVAVAVRVHVDAEGKVSDTALASRGPSRYFSQLALESAHKWKFKPAKTGGHAAPSVWLLRYQFRNLGTDVTPVEESP